MVESLTRSILLKLLNWLRLVLIPGFL